jgi:hypothetical protein
MQMNGWHENFNDVSSSRMDSNCPSKMLPLHSNFSPDLLLFHWLDHNVVVVEFQFEG